MRVLPSLTARGAVSTAASAAAVVIVLSSAGCGKNDRLAFQNPTPAGHDLFASIAAAPIQTDRAFHTATRLDSGEVLIAGGASTTVTAIAQAERFVPLGQLFETSGTLVVPRGRHTATLLKNKSVVLIGGRDAAGALVGAAEIYDPGPDAFSAAPGAPLAAPRESHTATRLDGGSVVVAGGTGAGGAPIATVERFVPGTGFQALPTTPALTARTKHTASLTPSDEVMLAGGFDAAGQPLASVEFLDTGTGRVRTAQAGLNVARGNHGAVTLGDGRILIFGGSDATGALAHAEVYDPVNERSFNVIGGMLTARDGARGVRLIDGRVLVTGGGGNTAEIFDGSSSSFGATGTGLAVPRQNHTLTFLKSAEILIFGGGGAGAPAELFVY